MTYHQTFAAPDGTELVVIPKAEYDRLTAVVDDDAHDIAAAERARADAVLYPADVVDAMIDGLTPLAAWRAHRKLTQAKLADMAGITQAGVARLETRKGGRTPSGTLETRRALAKALGIPVAALDPLED